jgi:hypothetical protein
MAFQFPGFTRRPSHLETRWALTPPFHPYLLDPFLADRRIGGLLSVALAVTFLAVGAYLLGSETLYTVRTFLDAVTADSSAMAWLTVQNYDKYSALSLYLSEPIRYIYRRISKDLHDNAKNSTHILFLVLGYQRVRCTKWNRDAR